MNHFGCTVAGTWWAHIGGFILGIVLVNLFPKRKPTNVWWC